MVFNFKNTQCYFGAVIHFLCIITSHVHEHSWECHQPTPAGPGSITPPRGGNLYRTSRKIVFVYKVLGAALLAGGAAREDFQA